MKKVSFMFAVVALTLCGGIANADPLVGDIGCHFADPGLTPSGAVSIAKPLNDRHVKRSVFKVSGRLSDCAGSSSGGAHPGRPVVGGKFSAIGRTGTDPTCGAAADPATPSYPVRLFGTIVWRNSHNPSERAGTSQVTLFFGVIDTTTYAPSIAFSYKGTATGAFAGRTVRLELVSAESWVDILFPACLSEGWNGFTLGNVGSGDAPASYVVMGTPDFSP